MARLSYRRRVTGRRTSARANSSWSAITRVGRRSGGSPRGSGHGAMQPPLLGQRRVAEDLAQPLDLGRVVAGDRARGRPAAALSSSALTLVSSPENRSTLSIRRWQVASSESAARAEMAIDGKRISRSKVLSTE